MADDGSIHLRLAPNDRIECSVRERRYGTVFAWLWVNDADVISFPDAATAERFAREATAIATRLREIERERTTPKESDS